MYKISPSSLNLMIECPHCFWLKVIKKIDRPQGPMAGIVMKMDSIIKHYFDKYRELNQLPPIIEGKVNGSLPKKMPKTLKFDYNKIITIVGKPDDYIEIDDGLIIPLDHKTKSKSPEEAHPANIVQMHIYSYLLEKNNYKTTNKAYLAFYYPEDCELHNGMDMKCTIIEIKTSIKKAEELLDNATDILELEEPPKPSKECEYCWWAKGVVGV